MLALGQTGMEEESKDGMDLALCAINKETLEMEYSGAYRPAVIIKSGTNELVQLKPSKHSIGGHSDYEKKFGLEKIQLEKGDTVYLFSDGVVDQFGGPKGKKLLLKRVLKFLQETNYLPAQDQKEKLIQMFDDWKQDQAQVDDICLIGVEV